MLFYYPFYNSAHIILLHTFTLFAHSYDNQDSNSVVSVFGFPNTPNYISILRHTSPY